MKQFGVGVVGAGIMGRRMMAALQLHPRFRVAALWDAVPQAARMAQQAQAAAQQAGAVRCAASLDALVNDPEVELVYIASPPAFHLEGVRSATAARRACLCEKPLAHTVADALAMRELVANSGLPFAVHFPLARSEAANQLLALVHGGRLGKVERASLTLRFARWPRAWQQAASGWLAGPEEGGFTREVMSHFVFLAHRLFGPAVVEELQLERAPGETETRLLAQLVHASVRLSIDAAVGGDLADYNRFEVIGQQDRAALTGWSRLEHRGQTSEPGNAMPATLDGLAAMLEGRTDHGLASVHEALAVALCVESMLRDPLHQ